MTPFDIVRAWKDEDYRRSLDADQLAHLPTSPVGGVELSDADLGDVAGGINTYGPLCAAVTINCSHCCSSWDCPPPA